LYKCYSEYIPCTYIEHFKNLETVAYIIDNTF